MANKPLSPNDVLAGSVPAQANPVVPEQALPAEVEFDYDAIQKEKAALELEELREKRSQVKEDRRIQLAARKQNAEQLEQARKNQETIQALCPHQKPNGQPAIAGQRDHQHHYIFICAYCSKTFNEHTLPAHLRIPAERVGGPNV